MAEGRVAYTVFSVATGLYLDYWADLARSADERLFPSSSLQLIVFTDRDAEAEEMAARLNRTSVDVVRVPALRWPEATLQRYELLWTARDLVRGDVLMHLDADMLVTASPPEDMDFLGLDGGVGLVEHPGYFGRGISKLLRDVVDQGSLRPALSSRRLRHAAGRPQWESRRFSQAFVPRSDRKVYVCGGAWLGERGAVISLCGELAERTKIDKANGITARWHDESHLNWYAATHKASILPPSFCMVESYPHLAGLAEYFCAVEKGANRVRA